MQRRRLGRTDLRVSLLGIGTGGPSNFGLKTGIGEAEVARMVRHALDRGVNFFDSARGYGDAEALLGRVLTGVPRDAYVLCTKFFPVQGGAVVAPRALRESVERSLRELRTDCVDLLLFHSPTPADYAPATEALLPEVERLRERGLCRFVGVSENQSVDHEHEVLRAALRDDWPDAVMVAYGILAPSAADLVLPLCRERDVGVICMAATRGALSRPALLRARLDDAMRRGVLPRAAELEGDPPLRGLVRDPVESLPAAGFHYSASHPDVATVLCGTASLAHLESNLRALEGPPLPAKNRARLHALFRAVREPLWQA